MASAGAGRARREAAGPSVIADGRPADVVAAVEVQPVVGGDVVVGARHDALLHEDAERIVLEHSGSC